jgi:hypothetical protein
VETSPRWTLSNTIRSASGSFDVHPSVGHDSTPLTQLRPGQSEVFYPLKMSNSAPPFQETCRIIETNAAREMALICFPIQLVTRVGISPLPKDLPQKWPQL